MDNECGFSLQKENDFAAAITLHSEAGSQVFVVLFEVEESDSMPAHSDSHDFMKGSI